ncbi:RNA pol II transcription cofactor [Madurella fahalii]|uniref:RNA pol II transcription cofactor n=1 Tax=Madurella fahalii TaxID=1157608 RepID=A0ABQ0G6X5_9PEZI
MKSLSSLALSIVVGICSILIYLFRQELVELTADSVQAVQELVNSKHHSLNVSTSSPLPSSKVETTTTSATSEEQEEDNTMAAPRAIRKVFLALQQSEGAGALVRRSVGTPSLRNFSPFLMLDHFSVSPGAGFPDHPHRGQETITYLLQGAIAHEDFAGNKGLLGPGDLQFMTAGRGIVHAEMPVHDPKDGKNVEGLQLWVDLPKALKGCEPRYRDLKGEEIPLVEADAGRVKVKVISGQSHGVDSVKDLAYTPVWLLDVEIKPGGRITQPLPLGWNAFAYTLEGEVVFGKDGGEQKKIGEFHNVVFGSEGEAVYAKVEEGAEKSARFVLIAGTPLDQKIVQYGPFVLTSQEEVYQAFMDYQTHSNGFERAKGWESEIGKQMAH